MPQKIFVEANSQKSVIFANLGGFVIMLVFQKKKKLREPPRESAFFWLWFPGTTPKSYSHIILSTTVVMGCLLRICPSLFATEFQDPSALKLLISNAYLHEGQKTGKCSDEVPYRAHKSLVTRPPRPAVEKEPMQKLHLPQGPNMSRRRTTRVCEDVLESLLLGKPSHKFWA